MTALASSNDFDYNEMAKILAATKNDAELFQAIVNTPFLFKVPASLIFLGITVLVLVNKKTSTIDRIALSKGTMASGTTKVSVKKFEEIRIPVGYMDNIIAKAIATGEPQGTADWQYMFNPELTAEEARLNQAAGGIAYSVVYPLIGARDGGAMIFSYFQYPHEIGATQKKFMSTYSKLVAQRLK